jgi:hypothetical protein
VEPNSTREIGLNSLRPGVRTLCTVGHHLTRTFGIDECQVTHEYGLTTVLIQCASSKMRWA